MKNGYITFTICLVLAGTMACKKKKDEDPQPVVETSVSPTASLTETLKAEFLANYANIAYSTANEAKSAAVLLKTAIDGFVAAPTATNLTACKDAYTLARKTYLQCEVFRGVSGPIDKEDGAPESWMNSWPLDEVYIDFVFNTANNPVVNTDTVKVGGRLQGFVNDPNQAIDKSTLLGLNTQGGEANISVGYHAIEFLLWGQDIYATSAGQRPYTDFLTGPGATAPNGDRRGAYLKTCVDLLVDNLTLVVDAWKPNDASNYRADFLKPANTNARLKTVVSGMTKMTKNEFAGQRILEALTSKEQENEHSCFSDLTKIDFKYDALGYSNVVFGTHTLQSGVVAVTGTGLKKLLDSFSSDKGTLLATSCNDLATATDAVYTSSTRYDQIILKADSDPDVVSVKKMADNWVKLSDVLNSATQTLGYGVVDTTPEQ